MIHRSPLSMASRVLLPTTRCLLPTVLLLLTAHCSLLTAHAQSATATLSGTVEDQNGAVIPGATVTLIKVDTGARRQTTTSEKGSFAIPLLLPSTYKLRVEQTGFSPIEVNDVVLNVGDQKSLQIQLKAGGINAMVQVNTDAPLVDESPAVGTVVDRQFVENMPLNGRSFQSLIELTPGVVLSKATAGNRGQFSVNGQRPNANYFTIDGVSANIGNQPSTSLGQSGSGELPGLSASGGTNNLVSVDALQEFRIQTSTYAAEFGRMPGAQISIITRSGTNRFSGTVFEYFRNDVLDANDWFNNSLGLKKPALRQNDFGGVLGGPLYLPRFGEGGPALHSGKNRTFFFFSYEGLRLRLPQTKITEVPSITTRQTALTLAPQIRPFLNAYPIPNGKDLGNGLAQFSAGYSDASNLNAASIRIDHTVSRNLTLFARYNYATSDVVQRAGISGTSSLNTVATKDAKTQTLTVGTTWMISPKISNDLRANWSLNEGAIFNRLDDFGGAVPLSESLIFAPSASRQDSRFQLTLSGGTNTTLVDGQQDVNIQRQVNIVDNISLVTASHQLKFGIDYRRLSPSAHFDKLGQFVTFTGASGSLTGRASNVLLFGEFNPARPLINNYSVYGQDTWRVTRRLTLTYGLRWEVNPPPRSKDNGNDPFALTGTDNPATIAFAPLGTPLYKTTYNNFAPRIGVSHQLSQKQGRETVLRGGFGIFYDLGYGQVANSFIQFPFSVRKTLLNIPFPLDPSLLTPLTQDFSAPVALYAGADPNLKLPYTYQWNIAVEHSLGTNQTISASYLGAAGRRLLREERLNNPNTRFQIVDLVRNKATSDYHAVQLQFQRRLSRGFQAVASYTWSKSIDIASSDNGGNLPNQKIDPQADRGPSDFDVRHAFTAAVTYNIPSSKVGEVAGAILGHWSVDTLFRARSATPIDVFSSRNLGFGSYNFRPDLVAGAPLYVDDPTVAGGQRINRAAFIIPTELRQGTLGRNTLRGFSLSQIDFALRRQFNLTEVVNLQFRAEAFNLFNHPNFADPIGNLSSGLFGRSTQMMNRSLGTSGGVTGGFSPLYQAGGSRSIQFGLKLSF
jgi:hypothetical protein